MFHLILMFHAQKDNVFYIFTTILITNLPTFASWNDVFYFDVLIMNVSAYYNLLGTWACDLPAEMFLIL